jgi:hypothetical protein
MPKLIAVGRHSKKPRNIMNGALLVWEAESRFGDRIWWWLKAERVFGVLRMELWYGCLGGPRTNPFACACMEMKEVTSWAEARRILYSWFDEQGYEAPEVTWESGVRGELKSLASEEMRGAF